MELAYKHISVLYCCMDMYRILSGSSHILFICSLKIIGMNKIYIWIIRKSFKYPLFSVYIQSVPSDLRDLETLLIRYTEYLASIPSPVAPGLSSLDLNKS